VWGGEDESSASAHQRAVMLVPAAAAAAAAAGGGGGGGGLSRQSVPPVAGGAAPPPSVGATQRVPGARLDSKHGRPAEGASFQVVEESGRQTEDSTAAAWRTTRPSDDDLVTP